MDFTFTPEQEAIRAAVEKICARFPADYWRAKDRDGGFPHDFHRAFASEGWLGICIPQEYGGAGLGITEAAIMMQAVAESGAGFSGASALHMNIFGLNPVVMFGSDEQKRRMLPPLIAGDDKACFAVTEPNAGLNTLKIATKAVRDGDRYVISGQKIWISTAQVANKILILARTTPAEAGRTAVGGPEPVLHRPRPALRRRARDREDGPRRRRVERAVHRRAGRCRSTTASARKGAALLRSCTASIRSAF